MKKYRFFVTREVVQWAEVTVEADSILDAHGIAVDRVLSGNTQGILRDGWHDSEGISPDVDISDPEVYEIVQ